MTLAVFALISSAVLVAAFVQGTTGVGFALIVAPVVGLLSPDLLPLCLLVLMLPLNLYVAWRERGAIDRSGAQWITGGRVLGTFAGIWVLMALSGGYLDTAVGVVTVCAATLSLVVPSFNPDRKAFVAAGIVTGITETATGIGGPPLALVYQHRAPATVRSTIALCFLVGELVSIAFLVVAGHALGSQFAAALLFIPALCLGAFLSRLSHRRVNARALRTFVLLFATLSGVLLLVRG